MMDPAVAGIHATGPRCPPGEDEILAAARAIGGVGRGGILLWRELSDPGVEPRRLSEVLHGDPGVAARVMRVANSAFHARGRTIASIERAIVVLGLDAVRGIAAAAALDRLVERNGQGEALVAHCAAVAACAQAVARRFTDLPPAEAFLAGLLHDFGLLVEWRLTAVRALVSRDPRLHERYGGLVLAHWNLPPGVVDAAQAHHSPGAGGPLAACVRLAHAVATGSGRAEPCETGDPAAPVADPVDLALLAIDDVAWLDWCAGARRDLLDAAEALRA